jgi:hypothetical protein
LYDRFHVPAQTGSAAPLALAAADAAPAIRKGELGKTGTTFCFVDHRGTIVIPCTFARGGTFDHGVAYVDSVLIDHTGKKLWP